MRQIPHATSAFLLNYQLPTQISQWELWTLDQDFQFMSFLLEIDNYLLYT